MKITTQNEFAEHEIAESLGIVRGSTIRARHVGRDIMAGLKSIVGGEIRDYTVMMDQSREEALDRMEDAARELNADGIVCVRFATADVMQNAAEVMAYGTAVKFR